MALLRHSVRRSAEKQDELQTNMEETILDFRQETMKALWHAFHMLDINNAGSVHVSQLKVITSTIGSKMGFDKAEEFLNKEGVLDMDFTTYFDVIKTELIDKQKRIETEDAFLGHRLNYIIKACWTFCNFERLHHCKSFTTEHCVVLWRLYNFLSETTEDGEPSLPVLLHPAEAALLLRDFIDITGQKNKESQIKEFINENQENLLTFTEFLNVFEKDYVTSLSNRNITIGLNHLYDTYILNILKKGKIRKRGFKVKTWKDRWLVLTPTHLKYFVSSDERVLKGMIKFDKECTIEVSADRPAHKPNRFTINTPKKPYEMSALDLKSKNEWVSAVELALSRVDKDPNIQKDLAHERCKERTEKRRLAAEEERRRQEDTDLLRRRENELDEHKRKGLEDEELLRARLHELEEERRKREEAEARWAEEQALREAEQQRLRDLEEIKRELERLLAEERQAKKDEEIVRNLQSKLLEEEFEKREELERLKKQQDDMLKDEREQKAVLESDRREQERLLAEAQDRLEQLEKDKAAAAEKMQEAVDKLQRAEKDRHIMEEKVKLWKTPVGLARPIQPHANPLVTHRGRGAFCKMDFTKRQPSIDSEEVKDNNGVNEAYKDNGNAVSEQKDDLEKISDDTSKESETKTENIESSNGNVKDDDSPAKLDTVSEEIQTTVSESVVSGGDDIDIANEKSEESCVENNETENDIKDEENIDNSEEIVDTQRKPSEEETDMNERDSGESDNVIEEAVEEAGELSSETKQIDKLVDGINESENDNEAQPKATGDDMIVKVEDETDKLVEGINESENDSEAQPKATGDDMIDKVENETDKLVDGINESENDNESQPKATGDDMIDKVENETDKLVDGINESENDNESQPKATGDDTIDKVEDETDEPQT